MLMLKKDRRNVVREVCLCSLVICVFLINAGIAYGTDVAICTISFPWPQDTYFDPEIVIMADLIQEAADVQLFGADDLDALADWVEAHIAGPDHLLILTGILPSTIYAAGNAEPDGSLLEDFLDAGNAIINTGEYAFYRIEGNITANEAGGLQNILDAPQAEMWQTSGGWSGGFVVTMTPTADGENYVPSLVEYGVSYALHMEDFEGTPWEVEIAVAENTDENLRVDGMIVNPETGGRLGIFVQAYTDIAMPEISFGTLIGEFVVNYYLSEVASVQADGKLAATWGSIKGE